MTDYLYDFQAASQSAPGPWVPDGGLNAALASHVDAHDGPVKLVSHVETGPDRTHYGAKFWFPRRIREEAAANVHEWTMHWKRYRQAVTTIKNEQVRLKGPALLAEARRWRGHCYRSPGAPPPQGCSDCSGFYIWLVSQFSNHDLPHQTKSIWAAVGGRFGQGSDRYVPVPGSNSIGAAFTDPKLALPGDGVEMWYPVYNPEATDRPGHIGVLTEHPHVMLDERSPSEPVAERGIEAWALQGFIRIFDINGPLKDAA